MRTPVLLSVALALVGVAPLLAQTPAPPTGRPTKNDTLAKDPFFGASEGATGTENPLAYDEGLALGTVQVDQGPNAGTLVRVTNTGRAPMTLAAPRLSGSDTSDFAVEIESSSLSAAMAAEGRLPRLPAPFRRLEGAGGPGLALGIQASELADLRSLREVALHDFPLADLGPVTLVLRRRELPIRADSKLVIDGREVVGGFQRLVGELQIWSGHVSGMAGSRVFLAVDGSAARGFVELPSEFDRWIYVVSDGAGQIRLVRDRELDALGLRQPADVCAGQLLAPGRSSLARTPPQPHGLPTAALTATDCRLAIETDWQLYQKFNSSALLTSYVTGLVAAASDQYFMDVQSTLSIAYLGLHTTSNDGWTSQENGGGTYELLEEFRAVWGTTWPAEAELAHFLSGADLGGGIAYVDVLCHQEYGFGVSANLFAGIDWPNWTGAPGDFWDYLVFTHELGHNFGSWHTHDYCPPLDDCASNCTGLTSCPRGTIMGYCHGCPGGVSNVDLRFHPVTAEIIRERVNASCMDATVLRPGDFVQYRVRFNPWLTTGAKSAALELEHDAPNALRPFRVQLSGTAN